MTSEKKMNASLVLETSIPSIPSSRLLPYNSNDSIILESFSASLSPNPKQDHLEKLIIFVSNLKNEKFVNQEEYQESLHILNELTLKALSLNKDPTFLRVLKAYGWTGMRFQSLTSFDPKTNTTSGRLIFDFNKFLQALSNIYLKLQFRNPVSLENILDSEGINHIEKIAAFCPDIVIEYLEQYPRIFTSPSFSPKSIPSPTMKSSPMALMDHSFTFFGACMLIDISGFSKFSASMCSQGIRGLDELRKVTSGLLGKFVKAVYEHDGDVIAFAGDAIICVFREYDQLPTSSSQQTPATNQSATPLSTTQHKASVHFATPILPTKPSGLPKGKSTFNLFGYGTPKPAVDTVNNNTNSNTAGGQGSGEKKITSLKQVDACIRALHCAHLLHTVQYVELATHIGIAYSKLYLSFLGGHHGQYQYIINGKGFTQLSSCLDDAQRQMVVVTKDVYDRVHSLPYETIIQYPSFKFQKIDTSVNYQLLEFSGSNSASHVFSNLFVNSVTGRDNIQNILYHRKTTIQSTSSSKPYNNVTSSGVKNEEDGKKDSKIVSPGIGMMISEELGDDRFQAISLLVNGPPTTTATNKHSPLTRKHSILQQSSDQVLSTLPTRRGSSRNLSSIRRISMDNLYSTTSPPLMSPRIGPSGMSMNQGNSVRQVLSGDGKDWSVSDTSSHHSSHHHIGSIYTHQTPSSNHYLSHLSEHSISSILSPSSFYMKRQQSASTLSTRNNSSKPPATQDNSLESYRSLVEALTMFLPLPIISALHAESNHQIGELRTVTTMFLCLNSFSYEKNLDPITLQPFFLVAQQALVTTGGFLRQFLIDDKGCVLIGMWGIPSYTYANNASRAIYCAVEIQQRLAKELEHSVSIGITTGTVFCGTIGALERCDYVGIGNEVNLAARFMSKAKEHIYIDASTYERLNSFNRQLFTLGPELVLKGMPAPIRPYVYEPQGSPVETTGSGTTNTISSTANIAFQDDLGSPTVHTSLKVINTTEDDAQAIIANSVNALLHPQPSSNDTKPLIMPSLNSIDHQMNMKNKLLRRKVIHLLEKQLDKLNQNYGNLPVTTAAAATGKKSVDLFSEKRCPEMHSNNQLQTLHNMRQQFISTKLFPQPSSSLHSAGVLKNNKFDLKPKQQEQRFLKEKAMSKKEQQGIQNDGNNILMMNNNEQQPEEDNIWKLNAIDVTILCGHSGAGKTTAVQYFRYSARERNLPTIAIQAQSKHRNIPFGVIKEIFIELIGKDNFRSIAQQKSVLDALLLELFTSSAPSSPKSFSSSEKHKARILLYAIFNVSMNASQHIMHTESSQSLNRSQSRELKTFSSSSSMPMPAIIIKSTSPLIETDMHIQDVEGGVVDDEVKDNSKHHESSLFGKHRNNKNMLSMYEEFAQAIDSSDRILQASSHSAEHQQQYHYHAQQPTTATVFMQEQTQQHNSSSKSLTAPLNPASTEANQLLYQLLVILLRTTPTVLIIENAHFCDELSWNELHTLIQDTEINVSILLTMKTNPKHRIQQLQQQQSRLRSMSIPNHLPVPRSSFLSTHSSFLDNIIDPGAELQEGKEEDEHLQRLQSLGLDRIHSPSFVELTRQSNCLIYEMKNLTYEEVKHVLQHMLKTTALSESLVNLVYDISSGNTFWCKMIATFILENGIDHLEEMLQLSSLSADQGQSTKLASNDFQTPHQNALLRSQSGMSFTNEAELLTRMNSGQNFSSKSATARRFSHGNFIPLQATPNSAHQSIKPAPHALQTLILYRIEMLSMDMQIVLRYASIVGLEFTVSLLEAILPPSHAAVSLSSAKIRNSMTTTSANTLADNLMPDPNRPESTSIVPQSDAFGSHVMRRSTSNLFQIASLITILETLEKHGFIYCVSEEENAPQCMVFAFQNELIQSTVYELIPPSDASTIHASIATHIEQEYGPNLRPFYPTLAYHYQLSSQPEIAFRYELKSSALALSVGAYSDCYTLTISSLSLATNNDQYELILEVCDKAIIELTPMSDVLPIVTKPTPKRHQPTGGGGGVRSLVHTFSQTFASFFVTHSVRQEEDPYEKVHIITEESLKVEEGKEQQKEREEKGVEDESVCPSTPQLNLPTDEIMPVQITTPKHFPTSSNPSTPKHTVQQQLLVASNGKKVLDVFNKQPSFLLPQPTSTSTATTNTSTTTLPLRHQSSFPGPLRPAQSVLSNIPPSIFEESSSSASMCSESFSSHHLTTTGIHPTASTTTDDKHTEATITAIERSLAVQSLLQDDEDEDDEKVVEEDISRKGVMCIPPPIVTTTTTTQEEQEEMLETRCSDSSSSSERHSIPPLPLTPISSLTALLAAFHDLRDHVISLQLPYPLKPQTSKQSLLSLTDITSSFLINLTQTPKRPSKLTQPNIITASSPQQHQSLQVAEVRRELLKPDSMSSSFGGLPSSHTGKHIPPPASNHSNNSNDKQPPLVQPVVLTDMLIPARHHHHYTVSEGKDNGHEMTDIYTKEQDNSDALDEWVDAKCVMKKPPSSLYDGSGGGDPRHHSIKHKACCIIS